MICHAKLLQERQWMRKNRPLLQCTGLQTERCALAPRCGLPEKSRADREQAMGALLEQAFRIKDDIIASLNTTQSSVQMEAFSRRLLENHIRTITHIVKQLSQNIEVLESQIVRRDGVSSDTRFALQFLDQKNLAGIGDLRGRVARCADALARSARMTRCLLEPRKLAPISRGAVVAFQRLNASAVIFDAGQGLVNYHLRRPRSPRAERVQPSIIYCIQPRIFTRSLGSLWRNCFIFRLADFEFLHESLRCLRKIASITFTNVSYTHVLHTLILQREK
uniref:Protein FAM81B-like n=1 Tax=Scleropages formosus TaxID=113540 RepID=A0A8C9RZG4_SCLFO